jgi:hypothetical protein
MRAQSKANPTAMLLATAMMMHHMGLHKYSARLEEAIMQARRPSGFGGLCCGGDGSRKVGRRSTPLLTLNPKPKP